MAIETVPIPKAQWTDLVLRMRIPSRRKTVAFALAKFANPDGTRVFPGQGKVADMAGLHETNARTHIRALVAAGMLTVVKRGGGRGGATNTYRLTRPADITTLPLWLDPDMNRYGDDGGDRTEEYQASALGEEDAGAPEYEAPAPPVSVDNSAETPVDNPETQSADAPHSSPADDEIPSDTARNTERYGPEYRALALPDLPKTSPLPTQHPAGLRKAPHPLVLVPPVRDDDEMTTEPEPTETPPSDAPPADEEFATARAVLDAMRPAAATAWRVVARRELEAAGVPLTKRSVEIRAAELASTPHTTEKTGT